MGETIKKYRKNHIDYQKLTELKLKDINRLYLLELKKRKAIQNKDQSSINYYENYIKVLKESEVELKNEG